MYRTVAETIVGNQAPQFSYHALTGNYFGVGLILQPSADLLHRYLEKKYLEESMTSSSHSKLTYMGNKLTSFLTLFFSIFGGTMLIWYIISLTSERVFDYGMALPEQVFIAFFISILLIFWNKVRLKWYTDKGEIDK